MPGKISQWDYYHTKIQEIQKHIQLLSCTEENNPALHKRLKDYWQARIDHYRNKIKQMKR